MTRVTSFLPAKRSFWSFAVVLALGMTQLVASGQSNQPIEKLDMAEVLASSSLPDRSQGAEEAPIVIVEYAALTCIWCARFHLMELPELKERFLDKGKVRIVFRNYPLRGRSAFSLALLSRALPEERFFPFVKEVYEQFIVQYEKLKGLRREARALAIEKWASEIKEQTLGALDPGEAQKVRARMKDAALAGAIKNDASLARNRFSIKGIPTFIVNGEVVKGSGGLLAKVDKLLRSLEEGE